MFCWSYLGTTTGRVIKTLNAQAASSREGVQTVIIEELQVFESNVIVKDLKIMGGGGAGRRSLAQLAVMSRTEVRSFPVQRCDRAATCAECVALQDPYCAWETRSSRCSSGDWTKNMASSFLQSVSTGEHPKCPGPPAGETASQVFSYERQMSNVRLGQVVNIIDESQTDSTGSRSSSGSSNGGSVNGGGFNNGPGVKVSHNTSYNPHIYIVNVCFSINR